MSKYSILFGSVSTYLLLGIYLILWLVFKFNPQSTYVYCGVFYFVACYIFGPASSIFAFLFWMADSAAPLSISRLKTKPPTNLV